MRLKKLTECDFMDTRCYTCGNLPFCRVWGEWRKKYGREEKKVEV